MNGRLVLSTSLLMLALAPGAAHASDWIWSPAGSLLQSTRGGAAGARLADGRVLIAGGDNYGLVFSSVERYDPATNAWSRIEAMAGPHAQAPGVVLPDGRVLVAGGRRNSQENNRTAEVFDPKTGHWTSAGTMNEARALHAATLLADGRVLAVGGDGISLWNDIPIYALNIGAETWDPKTNVWTPTGPLKYDREGMAVARLKDGRVLLIGGWNADELDSVEIFDPTTNTWSDGPPISERLSGVSAVTLPDGRVLIAGGSRVNAPTTPPTPTFYDSRAAELFDPATGTWTKTGDLNIGRGGASLSVLPDGRAVLAGGFSQVASNAVGPTEIYDPATGVWTLADPLAHPRSGHIAEVLLDGSLLVAGGYDGGASAERFHPGPEPTPSPTPIATVLPVATSTATPVPQPPAQRPGVPKLAKLPKTLTLTRAGTLSVKVSCSAVGACQDTLILTAGKTTLAKANVRVAKGKTATITLKLAKNTLRKVSRKGTKVTLELTGTRVVARATVKRHR
ncbi:MAG TPA: kelch repeat-containing protein [Solirubrobacter sp.]